MKSIKRNNKHTNRRNEMKKYMVVWTIIYDNGRTVTKREKSSYLPKPGETIKGQGWTMFFDYANEI